MSVQPPFTKHCPECKRAFTLWGSRSQLDYWAHVTRCQQAAWEKRRASDARAERKGRVAELDALLALPCGKLYRLKRLTKREASVVVEPTSPRRFVVAPGGECEVMHLTRDVGSINKGAALVHEGEHQFKLSKPLPKRKKHVTRRNYPARMIEPSPKGWKMNTRWMKRKRM